MTKCTSCQRNKATIILQKKTCIHESSHSRENRNIKCAGEASSQAGSRRCPNHSRFVWHLPFRSRSLVDKYNFARNRLIKIESALASLKVYIPAELYEAVREEYHGEEFLFESNRGKQLNRSNILVQVKKAGRRAGFPNVTPRDLRHARATDMLLEKDISLKVVSRYRDFSKQEKRYRKIG